MPRLRYNPSFTLRGEGEAQPRELIDRSHTVQFDFEGRPVRGHEGDTVASALYAAGVTTFSRSFKYHRPRGLLCAAGRCPNCLMTVDGAPNIRACTERVREGMKVRHQNAWPSLDHDFLSVLDRLHWLMPVGFYYKALYRPKLLWRLSQRIIRRIGGLGRVDIRSVPETHYRHRNQHTSVAVVGGGPAGMSAALAAAAQGARVTLIDDQPQLGGQLRFDSCTYKGISGLAEVRGFEAARQLAESVGSSPNIEVLCSATAFGLYQDNLLGVLHGHRRLKLRAKRVVIATGSDEVPLLFDGNDLPGVMLSSAALRLARLYGVRPGRTAVIATNNDQGYQAALDLLESGVEVAAVVDARPESAPVPEAAALKSRGVGVLTSHSIVRAEGKKRVTAAAVARLEGGDQVGPARRIRCDLICMSGGFQAANSLLYQAGCSFSYDESLKEFIPSQLPAGVYVAGRATGIHDLAASVLQGQVAGIEAASSLGLAPTTSGLSARDLRRQLAEVEAGYRRVVRAAPLFDAPSNAVKRFVCFCEDVTVKDVKDAIDEGFEDIQMLKRYTTATMGPCQGKMCLKALVGLCAERTGRSTGEIGVTTARPPFQPVPLAALAGPSHLPVKRTPMDRKHRELGAPMVELGPWQRAYSYGSPQEECLAVRNRVGIIDVSTLGKLDVRGRDAPALLDKVYTHHFSNLQVGRIRYGLLCADNSTILDDGTVTRLAQDHYFVTTTTGNVDLIEEWFKWWIAGASKCVHVNNVTSAFAAVNVAGPRARETLSKLTEVDLSEGAFRYLRSAQGRVAGVPALLLRIGFVGEAGWELHFPAEHGEYLWDSIMEAGREFGIAPFGLEAQRILRLEKKHIIVGQDTDALSNPLESDMEWVVRFDKMDFVGRDGLKGVRQRGLRNKLVGFVMRDGLVPKDGNLVMQGKAPVGRVTSARLSPTLGKGFGLAWVPISQALEGSTIDILVDGKALPAEVTLRPFYDPEGSRLRE